MSYYRPPKTSSLLVWAGRAAAIAALVMGVGGFLGNQPLLMGDLANQTLSLGAKAFSLLDYGWPLLMGAGGGLAVWRNAEKAAQVNRDTSHYHRQTERALTHGLSEVSLPERMLDKSKQASAAATFMGKTFSSIGIAIGAVTATLVAVSTGPLAIATGVAMIAAGVIGWRVSDVAAEARDFAWSNEASAERGRIALARERASGHAAAIPAVSGAAPVLFNAQVPAGRASNADSLSAADGHRQRLLAERNRATSERLL